MKMLSRRGRGLWNRLMENLSRGPIRIKDLVVFLIGSRIVVVASLYRVIGEKEEITLWTRSCRISISASTPEAFWLTGATTSDRTLAPRLTKKEKKIQTARDARAEVAVLRKTTEKRIDIPNQKEM